MSFYLKDPSSGQPSVSLTAFAAGFAVATFKLLVSGMAITKAVTFSTFSGGDFSMVVGALAALYYARRKDSQGNSDDTTKS